LSSSNNAQLFLKREKRVQDAIRLEKPDRVPIVAASEFFFTRSSGLKDAEAMYDYDRMAAAWKESMTRYDFDMAPLQSAIRSGKVMELLGMKTYKWPGFNLAENSYYQWVEAEYMLADEYDDLLKDPADFIIRKLMPRMATVLEPLAEIPPVAWLGYGASLLNLLPIFTGQPRIQEMMDRLKKAGNERTKWFQAQMKLRRELEELGYPLFTYAVIFCAFDWVSDCLRGLKGSTLDMYRQPDKLKALIKYLTPFTVQMGVAAAKQSGIDRVFIPLHRGADGFMNKRQFEEFYWPCLRELLIGLINEGLTPAPFFEGGYSSRLEYLAELPPKKVLGHFDQVDRKKCKEILGNIMCFWGNVPASLLISGSPDQVKADVRELIEIFADNGGLIVDASTTGPPPESKPENVLKMAEAVFEYGEF
jgi:uroporphyrinogen-III decarboxylase